MVEEGIHDGDVVIVRRAGTAADAAMVVALVGGEVTLKRLYREAGGRVRLQPSNAALPPLVVPAEQVQVQGIVVGLLRRY
jgi:repressor LexA